MQVSEVQRKVALAATTKCLLLDAPAARIRNSAQMASLFALLL